MSSTQGSLPFDAEFDTGATAALAAAALLRGALPATPGEHDELRSDDGALRPPWQRFAGLMPAPAAGRALGAELDHRRDQVAQQIRRDGVTHNVFGSEGVASRPWSLEVLPQLIEAADWAVIEAGVAQRAALLEAVLADIYGAQRLLHEGLLPPALLLRHPGYLRPLLGVTPPGGLRLHILAFDLARGPDGAWWLVAQRTQGPSGLGYVMHNRLVISRQFPDAFRELRVQHIASSYRRLLDTVDRLARELAGGHAPRIVLLTPGPYSETYFEHTYLARYLGLPLVEGSDLTVRGERLFLKTVEGLEPVHGVLRRLDDEWCDPLELRPDSALGVPGLLQAVRAGAVVMANALGSAVLETPALQGFMPAIAQRLSGRALTLPALPSWWCGETAAWDGVRSELPGMVVRNTFPSGRRSALRSDVPETAIDQDSEAWTVQGRLRHARAPVWGDGVLTPRPAMVRVYAIADGLGHWHVLPGGMTRVAQGDESSVSMQHGGTSLDTWVLTDGPVDTFSMLPRPLQVDDIARRHRPVSSRTGENLFWMGRYAERTEQLVRLARATLALIDADNDADGPVLRALSTLALTSGLVPEGAPTLAQAPLVFERAMLAGLADASNGASVAANLESLARTAQALRERLSVEHWSLLRAMGDSFAAALRCAPGELPALPQVLPALDHLVLQLAAATGAQTDRMTRDHGWRLLTVGRLLERLASITARVVAFLDNDAVAGAGGVDLMLELFDSAITFRARYQRHEDLLALVDLLVLDSANPRSFAGVLRRLRTELGKLPGSQASLQLLLARLPAEGAGLTLESLRGASDAQIAQSWLALARTLNAAAADLADDIGNRYFALAQGADQSV